ncbi:MAG TPA: hypothetical protein VIS56_02610, partial [Candidatus Saccharimonadales bacterium]
MRKNRVLIVSNRLPVNFSEQEGHLVCERSIGGVATALDAVAKRVDARWAGWTGYGGILEPEELTK